MLVLTQDPNPNHPNPDQTANGPNWNEHQFFSTALSPLHICKEEPTQNI